MSLQEVQTIKELFPIVNGIFGHMNFAFRAEVTKASLDVMFVSNFGKRNPSPIVETIQETRGRKLTDAELTTLAAVIVEMYSPKWSKLGNIYEIQYDPIHNYLDEWEDTSEAVMDQDQTDTGTKTLAYGKTIDSTNTRTDNLTQVRDLDKTDSNTRTDNLTELETRNLAGSDARTDNLTELETRNLANSNSRTDNLTETHNYGKTSTRTDNLTEATSSSETSNGSGSENNSLYGFNSSTAVNTDSSATSDTNTTTSTGSKGNTGTQATAETGSDGITNTGTQSNSGTDTGTVTTANTGTQSTVTSDTGTVTTANTGTQSSSGSGTVDETVTNTGTRTDVLDEEQGGSDVTTNNLAHTNDYTETKDRSGVHRGNIGNLTSQKQILEEINLWRWNYMKEILDDVKEFCTLPVYLNATKFQIVDD